jgi:hypothetical protein
VKQFWVGVTDEALRSLPDILEAGDWVEFAETDEWINPPFARDDMDAVRFEVPCDVCDQLRVLYGRAVELA